MLAALVTSTTEKPHFTFYVATHKQLLSHFPKLAQAVGGGDCRDSSRFPFRVCLVTGFPSATVFAVEDGGGKL